MISKERLRIINRELRELTKSKQFYSGDVADAFREGTVAGSRALTVARVSVWLFAGDRSAIRCVAVAEHGRATTSEPRELLASQYPLYFAALESERMIIADNAQDDPRTSEFRDLYLRPHGITSMLDVALRLNGTVHGVLCFEHIGEARAWAADEQLFVTSLADLISISIEVQERKRAEALGRQLEQQLIQAQKMEALGTLSGGIAHDFNNIIAIILGNAELLGLLAKNDPKVQQRTNNIIEASLRGRSLVRQILAFSRKQQLELQKIAPLELIQQICALITPAIPGQVKLTVSCTSALPELQVDPHQLEQALVNLIINAVHAIGDAPGVVAVEATVTNNTPAQLQISVTDSGCGIAPEHLPRIFEPFFTTKGPGKGTGLGLSVVHRIVQNHGGEVRVDSTLGKGTTITIALPLTGRALSSSAIEAGNVPVGNNELILIVDDERPVGEVMTQLLASLGYRAELATSAAEALRWLTQQTTPCQLVITDLTMPEMNGAEFATRARANGYQGAILLQSGFASETNLSGSENLFNAILTKPITRSTLAHEMQRALHPDKTDP